MSHMIEPLYASGQEMVGSLIIVLSNREFAVMREFTKLIVLLIVGAVLTKAEH